VKFIVPYLQGASLESFTKTPSNQPETSVAPVHPLPTKVSSISNTNENKGVSIARSHAVPGKSSTDGTSSAAGKSGNLSLDALAKAKKALQMQKELSEKLKKLPLVSSHHRISMISLHVLLFRHLSLCHVLILYRFTSRDSSTYELVMFVLVVEQG
jgi:U4/U6 small nuclear ribonucleoprotein PRP3